MEAGNWKEAMEKRIQRHVEGRILAVCVFKRLGEWGTAGLEHALGPIAEGIAEHFYDKRAGGLPESGVLALTATHVYACHGRVGAVFAEWPRDALEVEAPKAIRSGKVTFHFPATGARVKLNLNASRGLTPRRRRSWREIGEEFLRVLLEPATPPTPTVTT